MQRLGARLVGLHVEKAACCCGLASDWVSHGLCRKLGKTDGTAISTLACYPENKISRKLVGTSTQVVEAGRGAH